jgi:hypothetical protein
MQSQQPAVQPRQKAMLLVLSWSRSREALLRLTQLLRSKNKSSSSTVLRAEAPRDGQLGRRLRRPLLLHTALNMCLLYPLRSCVVLLLQETLTLQQHLKQQQQQQQQWRKKMDRPPRQLLTRATSRL